MNKGILLALLLAVSGLAFAIQPAQGWTVVSTSKLTPGTNANVTTEGGNVTNLNLAGNVSTEKWAGYWGNVSGRLVLAPSSGSLFYTWAWTSANGGEVCAVAAPSGFNWATLALPVAAQIDTAFGFLTGETDATAGTLTTGCTVGVAGQNPAGLGNYTGVGGFQTCAISDGGTAKANYAFCVNITQGGSLFNGATGDYELLAPTNSTAGAFETHYFWLELD